jgi:hypothetical protein
MVHKLALLLHKTGNYVQDVAFTPPPVKQPSVPTPSPSTKTPKFNNTTTQTSSNMTKIKTSADATDTLLAGGVGGIGGWLIGEYLLKPGIQKQEESILAMLAKLRHAQKYAPVASAVAGASILAAIAALNKKNPINEINASQFQRVPINGGDYGFQQHEQLKHFTY